MVLAKLEPTDRQVVLDALDAADKAETELRYLADHDPLTALLNRRAFRTRLDTYVNFAARYGGRGAMMVIDVDGLKGFNDRLGHQQGDNLIRRVAVKLRERVRATDIVARLSGDEFAVFPAHSALPPLKLNVTPPTVKVEVVCCAFGLPVPRSSSVNPAGAAGLPPAI